MSVVCIDLIRGRLQEKGKTHDVNKSVLSCFRSPRGLYKIANYCSGNKILYFFYSCNEKVN